MHKHRLLKIGELANLSGVPVKTIRYYSDIDILPPTETSETGFRYYSGADAARLTLIRSLRKSGFGLSRIRDLLQNDLDVSTALTLQLQQIESKISHLRDQKTLLQVVLEHDDRDLLEQLNDTQILASLDSTGREHFLSRQLIHALPEIQPKGEWKSRLWLWQEGILRLPEKISGGQVRAWLELAELVLGDPFQTRLHELGETTWKHQWRLRNVEFWRLQQDEILLKALKLAQQGQPPQSQQGQVLVQEFVGANAVFMERSYDANFPGYLLELIDGMVDPVFDRYWTLIGILRKQTPETMWCKYQARAWLLDGLRWNLSRPD